MNDKARLALLRKDMESLLRILEPAQVNQNRPADSQRLVYGQLLAKILNAIDEYKSAEKRHLLLTGHVQVDAADPSFAFYRDQIEPRLNQLKRAYETVDPAGAEFYALLEGIGAPRGAGGRVRQTFDVAIEQLNDLIDRNPDSAFPFLPDTASSILDSKLINFDPDAWLDRVNELEQVRVERKNLLLPVHVRFRLEELFRAYVFGCWLSVLALVRAVLEYATLENAKKFGIDTHWPPSGPNGVRRAKTLEYLIDDLRTHLPEVTDQMSKLRNYGNEYLHPKITQISKETLFKRESAAKDAVRILTPVVEALYAARASSG